MNIENFLKNLFMFKSKKNIQLIKCLAKRFLLEWFSWDFCSYNWGASEYILCSVPGPKEAATCCWKSLIKILSQIIYQRYWKQNWIRLIWFLQLIFIKHHQPSLINVYSIHIILIRKKLKLYVNIKFKKKKFTRINYKESYANIFWIW